MQYYTSSLWNGLNAAKIISKGQVKAEISYINT